MRSARGGFRSDSRLIPNIYTKWVPFKLGIDYQPRGDQVNAIEQLTRGLIDGENHQVLLGVTGSGKTFTMAKLIEAAAALRWCWLITRRSRLSSITSSRRSSHKQRGRVFRQLLRLLSARSLHSFGRHLHRERSHDQRRARQAAALGDPLAVRTPRLRHRRQRQLHLRPGIAGSLLRHAADARERAEDRAQGDHSQAGRDSVRAQRRRFPSRHVSRARRRRSRFSRLTTTRLSHRNVGR